MEDRFEKFSPLDGRQRRDPITLAEFTEMFVPVNRPPGEPDMYAVAFEKVRDTFRPGDELWVVVSERASWNRLGGWAKVEHVRDGNVVGGVVFAMN